MKIVQKNDANLFKDGEVFSSYEYDTKDKNINIARIIIHGRVPETGTMRNKKVKEVLYVESGEGTVTSNGVSKEISQGDVIFYDKNEEVAWEGNLVLITACSPAWSLDQHEKLP